LAALRARLLGHAVTFAQTDDAAPGIGTSALILGLPQILCCAMPPIAARRSKEPWRPPG
jgi:hypothetical protein